MNIGIEGNIGSCKSSLFKFIFNNYENIIKGPNSKDYSKNFIKNPKAWAFPMCINFLLSRRKKTSILGNIVTKRTHLTTNCYINACMNCEYLDEDLCQILRRELKVLSFPKYDYIIYIQSDPNECFERIIESGISNIDFSFLCKLHNYYEEYFKNYNKKGLIILNAEDLVDIESSEIKKEKLNEILLKKIPSLEKKTNELNEWTTVVSRRKRVRDSQKKEF